MNARQSIAIFALLGAGMMYGCDDDDDSDNGTIPAMGGAAGSAAGAGGTDGGMGGGAGAAGAAGDDGGTDASMDAADDAEMDAETDAAMDATMDGSNDAMDDVSLTDGMTEAAAEADAACSPPTCQSCCAALNPAGAMEAIALMTQCACGDAGKCIPECAANACASPPVDIEGTCGVCVDINCMADVAAGCTTAGCQEVSACLATCL